MDNFEEVIQHILVTPDFKKPKSEVRTMIVDMLAVLSEEMIQYMENIRQVENALQWDRGDAANIIWDAVKQAGLKNKRGEPYTFEDTCYFVSLRFLSGTKSYNTVKANALVSRRFSTAQRQRYKFQDVPFSHFAYAARRKFDLESPVNGKKIWQNILDYSYRQSIKQGYDCTVANLEAEFEGKFKSRSGYVSGIDQTRLQESTPSPVSFSPTAPIGIDATPVEEQFRALVKTLAALTPQMLVKFHSLNPILQDHVDALVGLADGLALE